MTTNQTIDGVPRELLREWLKALNSRDSVPVAIRKMRNELRALLDAPAECRCKRYGKGNPHWPCPVHLVPAARSQGEPVAWMNFDGEGSYEFTENKETADRWKFSNGSYTDWLTPLYTERPAPVAVVMPDQVKVLHRFEDDPISQAQAQGWNACLDELKRLNNTRPAHANPPPDAQPCGAHHDNDGLDEWRK